MTASTRRIDPSDLPSRDARRAAVRVIVADEFPIVREGIVRALHGDGIEVVAQSGSGASALELALALVPDVMVLDLHLRDGGGGLGVLGRLQHDRPEIQVLIMSAGDAVRPMLDAIAGGAKSYLSKGATAAELRRAVMSTHAGGSVITPALAHHLAGALATRTGHDSAQVRIGPAGMELDVLRLLVDGKTDIEIGRALFISPRTVQTHLARIRARTGLKRRSELTRWAVEQPYVLLDAA